MYGGMRARDTEIKLGGWNWAHTGGKKNNPREPKDLVSSRKVKLMNNKNLFKVLQ